MMAVGNVNVGTETRVHDDGCGDNNRSGARHDWRSGAGGITDGNGMCTLTDLMTDPDFWEVGTQPTNECGREQHVAGWGD